MLSQIYGDQEIGSVIADGTYEARKCHNIIADRDAQAFWHSLGSMAVMPSFPPRKKARSWKATSVGVAARNEALRASKYLGPELWQNWSGYRRRSRVETKMHCVKLRGQRLMARGFDRQVAEIQVRIAVLNGFTAPGIPLTEPEGWPVRRKEPRRSADLCNRATLLGVPVLFLKLR